MRRFPPPPPTATAAAASRQHTPYSATNTTTPTPATSASDSLHRSTEAPMQFEYDSPRPRSTSSFLPAPMRSTSMHDSNIASSIEDDGERARKRTHYEAMDLDTPPRPSGVTVAPGPASSSYTRTGTEPPPSSSFPTLNFDSTTFSASRAFGIRAESEPLMITSGSSMMQPANDARRRGSGLNLNRNRSPDRKGKAKEPPTPILEEGSLEEETTPREQSMGMGEPLNESTPSSAEEEVHLSPDQRQGMMAQRMKNGEFSFQVHHHHANNFGDSSLVNRTEDKGLNRHTPYVLLGYLHFTSLTMLLLLSISLFLLFIHTLYTDISDRLSSLTIDIQAEILACAKAYVDNLCDAKVRIPMSELACSGWERCMSREVKVHGKARVTAEVLAEVVNGFFEVISMRTMLFVLLSLGITIYASSMALAHLPSSSPPNPYHSQTHLPPYPSHFSIAPQYQQSHPPFHSFPPASNGEQRQQQQYYGGARSGEMEHRKDGNEVRRGEEKKKGWFGR